MTSALHLPNDLTHPLLHPPQSLTMKFSFAPLCFLAAATQVMAATVMVSYDTTYDVASTSLDSVACSDGANGLETKGYKTFGR
jgi:ABC-type sulfate transport system permease component